MKMFPIDIYERLAQNGRLQEARVRDGKDAIDFYPVVKIFCPDGRATWLLTEMIPADEDQSDDILFGLCDLGLGCPELGYVSMIELRNARGPLGLELERDIYFTADKTLSEYAAEANQLGYIKA